MAVGDVQVLFGDEVSRTNPKDATSSNISISINDGMVFNGTSSYAYINNFDLSDTDQMTISYWIYPTISSICIICEHSTDYTTNNNAFAASYGDDGPDKIIFFMADHKDANNFFRTIKSYPLNNWYHVVITKDRTLAGSYQTKIWVNGIKDYVIYAGANATLTSYYGNYPLYIGSRAGSTFFLKGKLCNFLIYKRILNEREIKDLYNSGRTAYAVVRDGLYVEYSGRDYKGSPSSPTLIYDTKSITRTMLNPRITEQALKELRTNANTKYLAAEINGKIMFAGIEEAA